MTLSISEIPTFTLTKKIAEYIDEIDKLVSKINITGNMTLVPKLRKTLHLKSVNSSISIEGNTLGFDKVKDTIRGKTVEGPFDEIIEAKNASEAYKLIDRTDLFSIDCFLKIESIMMWALVESNGFRDGKVVVSDGKKIYYTPPEASEVPAMTSKLFDWASKSGFPSYVLGAVMHYYIEAIHPFRDGNGRMGRFWHNAVLRKSDKIFKLISIETEISEKQSEYYRVLEECETVRDCTGFIEFMLDLTLSAVTKLSSIMEPEVSRLLSVLGERTLSSSQIMDKMGLKNRAHFLTYILRPALESGLVVMTDPEHPRSPRQKYHSLVFGNESINHGSLERAPPSELGTVIPDNNQYR